MGKGFLIFFILFGAFWIIIAIWEAKIRKKQAQEFEEYYQKKKKILEEQYEQAVKKYEEEGKNATIPWIQDGYRDLVRKAKKALDDLEEEKRNESRRVIQEKEEEQKAIAKGVVMGDLIFHSLEANKHKENKELQKKVKELNEQFKNFDK